jgi:hypothetical protein
MQPQYLDQYGSWYQIIDGDLHCCPANTDGSQDIEGWGPVEESGTGTWEGAIEFLNTINVRFGTQFKLPSFGWPYTEAGTFLDWMQGPWWQEHDIPVMIAPKILHIWLRDILAIPYGELVITTLHSYLEANAESLSPDEMKATNLLEVGQSYVLGVHADWVTIERVQ